MICARAASCFWQLGHARSLASLGVPAPRLSLHPSATRCDAQSVLIANMCEGETRSLLGLKATPNDGVSCSTFEAPFLWSLDHAKIQFFRKSKSMEVLDHSPDRISERVATC
ncbi:hypothetical protein BJX76DRAFT_72332 [Aspergillus varians]